MSRGAKWWRAADGCWYPPYAGSADQAPPGQRSSPAASRVRTVPVSPTSVQRGAWRGRREAVLGLVVTVLAVAALVVPTFGISAGTPPSPSGHVGQVIYDGGMVFRVVRVTCGVTHVGTPFLGATAPSGKQWCIAAVGVANTKATPQQFAAWDQYAIDTAGRSLPADTSAIPYLTGDGKALYANLAPGVVIGVRIPFELPASGHITAIELHDSAISAAVTVENHP